MLPPAGMAVVQSVDHFRAFIDDPFVFGEIAAAHALSDLHAMGARPWTALAVAAVPYAAGRKMRTELADMLNGATGVLAVEGCALVGGHSAEAAEPSLGFAVTGLADPATLLRKSGLRPGDALVLTKPLGTGIVLAGHMRGLAHAAWLQAAIASMRTSNAVASHPLPRVRGDRVHRCHRLRSGRSSDGDAASLSRRRGDLARRITCPARRTGTRCPRRRKHSWRRRTGVSCPPSPPGSDDAVVVRSANIGWSAGRSCRRQGRCLRSGRCISITCPLQSSAWWRRARSRCVSTG